MNELAAQFDALERARSAAEAVEPLRRILGVEIDPSCGLPPAAEPPRVAMLRYDLPRRIDLIALRAGARDVAKFEDLSSSHAAALERTLAQEGVTTVRVGPYSKRFDVTLADDATPGALFTVFAGRGTAPRAVAEAEVDRSAGGTRRVGELLGYPPCCVERFVAVSASAEAARDGVNEATIRAFVGDGDVRWPLNPLSVSSPIGFMPCSGRCERALAFAERILAALDTDAAANVERTLRRPILFFRYSAFFVLDGARAGDDVRYERAALNGAAGVTTIERWAHHVVGVALARAASISLSRDALVIGDTRLAVVRPEVPRLICFS